VPRACVKVFTTLIGTGVQTVTGIVDSHGNPFVGKLVFFQGGNAALNAVSYQDSANNAYIDDRGADDGTSRMATALGDISLFGIKVVSGGVAGYSLIDYQSDVFFGGNFQGTSYVSAFRLGEFDITYNNARADSVMCVVLGGNDFNADYGFGLGNGTISTTSVPAALFNVGSAQAMTSTLGSSTGAGGSYLGYGWDTNGSGRGAVVYEVINQGGNGRGQLGDRCGVELSSGVYASAPVVSSWDALSLTVSGATGPTRYASFAFSGGGLAARAGSFNQPVSTGQQTISLGINAKWVVLAGTGITTSVSASTDRAEFAMGWTDAAHGVKSLARVTPEG